MTSDDAADGEVPADGNWRESSFFRARPSDAALSWVADCMGEGSRVTGYRRLTGGVNSAVHRVTVERHGSRTLAVLRQYPPGEAAFRSALSKELANLDVVAGSGLPAPTVLGADVTGVATAGSPSLLMTRLPGHIDLNPLQHHSWLARIAQFAAHLHSLDLAAPRFRAWTDSWIAARGQLQVPAGAQKPSVWRAAFEAMDAPALEDDDVFLHCDYLPVNLLWSRGRITGLTDWNGIHRGSRAIDVGQCRRYVASLYSPDWAEELRLQYESASGVALDPWWDLYALLHHDDNVPTYIRRQVAGRRPVDLAGMTARVEVVVQNALLRLG